jgi:hypothetical protein
LYLYNISIVYDFLNFNNIKYCAHTIVQAPSEFGVTGETITSLGDYNIVGFGDTATLTDWQTDNPDGLIEANQDSAYGVGGENRGTVSESTIRIGYNSRINPINLNI